MSTTTVFMTIQWMGVGFIFLWFLGSSMKEGMWNNAITCFNAFVAGTVTLLLGGLVAFAFGFLAGMAGYKPDPSEPYLPFAIGMASMWLTYILCYLALSTITDYLSQVRVTFHPVVNGIGSFIFICGTAFVLFVFSSMGIAIVKMGGGQ